MFKKILIWMEENIIIAITLIALTVMSSYVINFSNFSFCHLNFSTKNDDWGTFGDYIGGVLNPIIAFCALYWVVKTYNLQKGESKKQVEIAALTALLNTDHSLFDYLNNEIQITKKTEADLHTCQFVNPHDFNSTKLELENRIKELINNRNNLESEIKNLRGKLNGYF